MAALQYVAGKRVARKVGDGSIGCEVAMEVAGEARAKTALIDGFVEDRKGVGKQRKLGAKLEATRRRALRPSLNSGTQSVADAGADVPRRIDAADRAHRS